jgi:hypothetical protein
MRSGACSIKISNELISIIGNAVLSAIRPHSTLTTIITSGASVVGTILGSAIPEDGGPPPDIFNAANSLFDYFVLPIITKTAYKYASKSVLLNVKTLLIGSILVLPAHILQIMMPENSECPEEDPKHGESSKSNPKKRVFLEEAIRLSKKSGQAVLIGWCTGSLEIGAKLIQALSGD